MSRQLRLMALASLEAFVDHINSYAGGNDWIVANGQRGEREEESGLEHIIIPMFNLRFVLIRLK